MGDPIEMPEKTIFISPRGILRPVFAVGVVEIMALARNLVTETLQSAAVYLIAGALYLCVTIPMARLAARLERQRQAWQ